MFSISPKRVSAQKSVKLRISISSVSHKKIWSVTYRRKKMRRRPSDEFRSKHKKSQKNFSIEKIKFGRPRKKIQKPAQLEFLDFDFLKQKKRSGKSCLRNLGLSTFVATKTNLNFVRVCSRLENAKLINMNIQPSCVSMERSLLMIYFYDFFQV